MTSFSSVCMALYLQGHTYRTERIRMIGEEKYNSPDSIPDLVSACTVSSADFNYMWDDCLSTFGANIPPDLLEDDEPSVEACTSSALPLFNQISVVSTENLSDGSTVQTGAVHDVFSSPGPSSSTVTPVASLVATKNWAGNYGFNIHFDEVKQQLSKGTKWIYSSKQDKLYVKKDVPCPIKFKTNQSMTYGTSIRIMAVYDDARYASDVVHRCLNHEMQDNDKGIPNAKHLIKCESDQACYKEDPVTHRLSVSVQYENPQSGENYSTYIFKFTCLGSCSGGLNRRPIKVVFTLECGGEIIGRRALDVRICASPRRDLDNDEKRLFRIKEEQPKTYEKNSKRKRQRGSDDEFSDVPYLKNSGGQLSKKARCTAPPNGPYCIETNDHKQYKFLKQMQKLYVMYDALGAAVPHNKQISLNNMVGSSDSSTEEARETDESDY